MGEEMWWENDSAEGEGEGGGGRGSRGLKEKRADTSSFCQILSWKADAQVCVIGENDQCFRLCFDDKSKTWIKQEAKNVLSDDVSDNVLERMGENEQKRK